MNPRGHPELAAVLMLLALVLSAMALLPATAQAATQVTGLVSQCGPTPTFLAGAQVTLSDANGVLSPKTTTTDGAGVYSFTSPPPANYTISVSKTGYYSNNTPLSPQVSPFRYDGSTTVTADVCLDAQPPSTGTVTFTVVSSANPSTKIGGAILSVYNPARLGTPWSALIGTNTTNASAGAFLGQVKMSLWNGSFEIRVAANGYLPYDATQTLTVVGATPVQIQIAPGASIVGHARDAATHQFISAGLTGWLYSPTAAKSAGDKVISAFINGSLYTFSAPVGSYRMVVDAKNYIAYDQPVTVTSGTKLLDVNLTASPQERDNITVAFYPKDWSNFTVYRNLSLNADSGLAGLMPAGLRDLREQINFTLGDGTYNGGTLSATDVAAFQLWLLRNGPLYVASDAFLGLNSKFYTSNAASFKVSVSGSLATAGEPVWINSSATYQVKSSAWISYGAPKYYLNLTVLPDTNVTVYHNFTYLVQLPAGYEMVSNKILPSSSAIATSGFQNITADPGVSGQAIQMVIQKSLTGIARAKVTGPTGKFYVVNATYQHYQAYVAANTNITFSAAETSNPPSNDSTRDNFTWKFLANGSFPNPPNNLRYGIEPTFNFTTAGAYIVNLTAKGSGGNLTQRNMDIWVDGSAPVGDFKTNRTGSGSAKGADLHVNQGTQIRFDGSLSTDEAYPGKAGVISNSGYAWDFNQDGIPDATGRVVNQTFGTPGRFIVNLTVTDSVGNKASNVSLTITVNDTEGPKPAFRILDPTNEYAVAPTLTEGRNYTFNASTTTDNYDKLSALNFTWYISGPLIGGQLSLTKKYGMNITFGWSTWNLSYQVKLVVNDTGFGSGKLNSGTLFQNISVQIDQTLHPDLYLVVSSVKIDLTSPESGQTVTVTVNVTNKPGWGPATQIYVTVQEATGSQSSDLSPTWSMTNVNGTAISTLASGASGTMRISFAVVGQGNKTLTITVADRNEPYTHVTSENRVTESIVVQQPAWVNYAIIGSVVAVFAVVIFAMYYRRKVKAGDWQPRFRRAKGEKGEGGREKPRREKEAKEEKKRL